MSVIKKFFEKKKLDTKFKKAGHGHKLAAASAPAASSSVRSSNPAVRATPTKDSRMAGIAALQRLEHHTVPSMTNRSQNVIRAQARKELETEMQRGGSSRVEEVVLDSSQQGHGVFFTCPLVGPDVLPKVEMNVKIKEFLYNQLEEEPGLTSCLIIHTCNGDKAKVQTCIETLTKCLDNIVENPEEEKYHRIRVNSRAFQDKIVGVEGSVDFLRAAGFCSRMLPHVDDVDEEFYVFDGSVDSEELKALRDALISAEPIRPELDRNVRVLAPAQQLEKVELPTEFYNLTAEELKREQQFKAEMAEQSLMLRTKAMRERDAVRERRRYRFCFVRIRFPDGLMLQGTFKTWEKLGAVKEFVQDHLVYDGLPFVLSAATGEKLVEDEATLADLGLVPAVVVSFAWDPYVAEDVLGAQSGAQSSYLKPETLALCSEL